MTRIAIEIEEDFTALVNSLVQTIRGKALRTGLRKAAKPIQKTLKAIVPQRTKTLSRSIGIKVKAFQFAGYAIVGARAKYVRTVNGQEKMPSRYSHIADKKHRFLQRAGDLNQSEFNRILRVTMLETIKQESAKRRAKGKAVFQSQR